MLNLTKSSLTVRFHFLPRIILEWTCKPCRDANHVPSPEPHNWINPVLQSIIPCPKLFSIQSEKRTVNSPNQCRILRYPPYYISFGNRTSRCYSEGSHYCNKLTSGDMTLDSLDAGHIRRRIQCTSPFLSRNPELPLQSSFDPWSLEGMDGFLSPIIPIQGSYLNRPSLCRRQLR